MNIEGKYQIHITKYAFHQIEEIKQYISCALFAPQPAKNLLLLMEKAISSLEQMPSRNPLVKEERWSKQGIRRLVVRNFLIYYRVDEETMRVVIIAVVYGRRDQLDQLRQIEIE